MAKPDLNTYGGLNHDIGYPGMIVDMNPCTMETKSNESTTAIDFGIAVARGSADETCKVIGADADKIIGISVRHAIGVFDAAGNVAYPRYAAVPVLKSGYIFATAFENVVRGDGVLSVTAQGGKLSGTTAGAAGTGRVVVPGATWETTTSAGQLGKIRINS